MGWNGFLYRHVCGIFFCCSANFCVFVLYQILVSAIFYTFPAKIVRCKRVPLPAVQRHRCSKCQRPSHRASQYHDDDHHSYFKKNLQKDCKAIIVQISLWQVISCDMNSILREIKNEISLERRKTTNFFIRKFDFFRINHCMMCQKGIFRRKKCRSCVQPYPNFPCKICKRGLF